jgi:hypothetical protein
VAETTKHAPPAAPPPAALAPEPQDRTEIAAPPKRARAKTRPTPPPPEGARTLAPALEGETAVVLPGGVEVKAKPVRERSKRDRDQDKTRANLSYISPLSAMKISFLVSIALGIAFVVAVFIAWEWLDSKAAFEQVDLMIAQLVGENRPPQLEILQYVERGRIMAGAAIVAVINVVILTAISTLLAVAYDIIAVLVGGVHVTLRED